MWLEIFFCDNRYFLRYLDGLAECAVLDAVLRRVEDGGRAAGVDAGGGLHGLVPGHGDGARVAARGGARHEDGQVAAVADHLEQDNFTKVKVIIFMTV